MIFNKENIFVLRWKDKKGAEQIKEYTDYQKAVRASNWLAKEGAEDIDLAIRLSKPLNNVSE